MWPLPDLYLLEMVAASFLGLWSIWGNGSRLSALQGILSWVVVGFLFGFVIIGSFSIGIWFMPAAVLFAIASILSNIRKGDNLVVHLCIGLAAVLAQAFLMFALIRLYT